MPLKERGNSKTAKSKSGAKQAYKDKSKERRVIKKRSAMVFFTPGTQLSAKIKNSPFKIHSITHIKYHQTITSLFLVPAEVIH